MSMMSRSRASYSTQGEVLAEIENISQRKDLDGLDVRSTYSVANAAANMAFFVTPTNERTTHSNSYSWKSPAAHLADEFVRIQRLVRHVAPEQFHNPARPSSGPCDIVPTTVLEYVEHVKDILRIKTQQMEKNLAARREIARVARISAAGENQPRIKSTFGKDAKVYADGLSPVLCRPTMWSTEYMTANVEHPDWPSQTELQECGDKRENNLIPTRCGRFLPPPRIRSFIFQHVLEWSDHMRPVLTFEIKKLLPLDEHGPIFCSGPSPVEIIGANSVMDCDAMFERRAQALLGHDLMEEIGEWSVPFVPEWLARSK